jgi:iron complex outermembrane receptor protein
MAMIGMGAGRGGVSLRGALLVTTALFALSPMAAQAQQAPRGAPAVAQATPAATSYSFAIPAGPLPQALNAFGRTTGLTVLFTQAEAAGAQSPGVSGAMTAEAALVRLLAGTGWSHRFADARTVTLARATTPDGAVALPEVRVQAGLIPPTATIGAPPPAFAGGQVASGQRLGVLGNRSLMETPFAVQTFTDDFLRDRQAISLIDLARVDPSVTQERSRFSYYDINRIRGFRAFYLFDGLSAPVGRQTVPALEFFERFEVFRGPAATSLAANPGASPGGTINLVPKRAGDVPFTEITGRYLGGSAFGVHVDTSRRFGTNNEWGVRVNAFTQGGETAVRGAELDRRGISFALDYRGERFRASFDLFGTDQTTRGGQPALALAAGLPVPRAPSSSRTLGQTWTDYRSLIMGGVLRAEYDVAPDWTVGAALGMQLGYEDGRYDGDGTIVNQRGDFNWTTGLGDGRNFHGFEQQAYVRGRFQTGPVGHRFTAAVINESENFLFRTFNPFTIRSNLYAPVRVADPGDTSRGPGDRVDRQRRGVVIADELGFFNDRVLITVGGRYTRLEVDRASRITSVQTQDIEGDKVMPIIAGLVRVTPWLSAFAGYTETLENGAVAPNAAVNRGAVLDPFVSSQFEAGLRTDFGTVGGSVTYFEIMRETGLLDPRTRVFAALGEQRNSGVELLVYGEPMPGLRILGGTTYIDAELTETAGGINNGRTAPDVPNWRIVGTVEADTGRLAGIAPGLSIYGSVVHNGRFFVDAANTQRAPSFTTLDLGLAYRFEINRQPITIRAALENVTGEDYWASAPFGSLVLGNPRTVLFSMSTRL